jgi:hypothetical protein
LIVHGTRSITFHSTAVRSITLSTVNTLLTVFGDLATIADFSCCTSSVVIAWSCLSPNRGNRCTRIATSFDDTPLGFKRFAFAYPSRNRGANSRSVGVFCTSSLTDLGFPCSNRCRSRASAQRRALDSLAAALSSARE